ncbi:MAG: hypothetical protein NC133_02140 [Prevotella sp.]|nr:hypothetical protein [Prevotella sp.]
MAENNNDNAFEAENNIDMDNLLDVLAENIVDNASETENNNDKTLEHDNLLNGMEDTSGMENISVMEDKPLLRSFMKYFTHTPANILRSVDFGRSLFRYFAPNQEIPSDPATLLNATRSLFTVGANDQQFTDEAFVRFLLHKIDKEPDLITFDMIADLVESDAYQKFGKTAQDKANKQKFERWIYDHSLLSKIENSPSSRIVLEQDAMTRVINAIPPSKKNQNVQYLSQIDAKIDEFDKTYLKNINDEELLKALKENANNTAGQNFDVQLKNVYNLLLNDEENRNFTADVIDSATSKGATEPKVRNSMLLGLCMSANELLLAASKRRNWSDIDFQDVFLKFPIEVRAAKFEQQQKKQTITKRTKQKNKNAQRAEEIETAATSESIPVTETQPSTTELVPVAETQTFTKQQPAFHPVFDVVKTFGGTLTGAAVISTITSIPGVGQIVGPALGISMVATAGIGSAMANYKAAKKRGDVAKSEAKKIAIQSGIAMLGKAWPYAAAMALGPAGRVLGSGVVFAKTLYNDLERRAGLQQEKAKGIFGKIKRLAQMGQSVSFGEGLKSLAYATGKSAAVFLGGSIGSEIGSSIGSNLSFNNTNGNLSVTANTKKMVDDLEQTKFTGKLVGAFKGLTGQEDTTTISPIEPSPLQPSSVENSQPITTEYEAIQEQQPLENIQLSETNLERLSQIGEVELTENARMTVHADNHRQYVGGAQQDWYNAAQEETALQTLRAAGVDDPAGVLRKVGSAARFFGGEYQATLDNLCAGNCTDQDVNQIFGALSQINEEGGLGPIVQQPTYQAEPVYESVTEATEVPEHTQEYQIATEELINDVTENHVAMPHYNTPAEPVTPIDPIDVPPHTQDYRTPNTTIAAEPMPDLHNEPVDIDNSIDYIEEENQFTNLAIPSRTADYHTPSVVDLTEPTSVELPSRTQDYIVAQETTTNQSPKTLEQITAEVKARYQQQRAVVSASAAQPISETQPNQELTGLKQTATFNPYSIPEPTMGL